MNSDYLEALKKYAFNSENYLNWRKVHGNAFGDIFTNAFVDNDEAQICLTAALINISQRKFEEAALKLDLLSNICFQDFDTAVVNYFIGLNCEMLGYEAEMAERYEELRISSVDIKVPLAFYPYYRTAKFAQRKSECSKAIYYYQKALGFYDTQRPSAKNTSIAKSIICDLATVCLYIHDYSNAEYLIDSLRKESKSDNQQADYVVTILCAIRGKTDECDLLLSKMLPYYRGNCEPLVESILLGTELHYCEVPQNRSLYADFWESVIKDKEILSEMIGRGNLEEAESIISGKLSKAFPFINRELECRVETDGEKKIVKCKNYYIKTLAAEYKTLFSMTGNVISDWNFVSVSEFEHF